MVVAIFMPDDTGKDAIHILVKRRELCAEFYINIEFGKMLPQNPLITSLA
jgi:hypothetical protein